MWSTLLIIIYCLLVAAGSLLGGFLPSLLRLTHTRMQILMSLVGGLMLGVALLHMVPHSFVSTGSLDQTVIATVVGLLATFFLIRLFHVHGHEPQQVHCHDAHGEEHPDDVHACSAKRTGDCGGAHQLSWVGLFIGLALHTLIDGIALAASVAAEQSTSHAGVALLGFGTFLVVLLHKPMDALAITSVMVGGGWSAGWRNGVNTAFALMCPLGALAFFFGVKQMGSVQGVFVGWALAFAAGAFLCISLADLLPEVQFHRHDRLKLTAALLLGVALAAAMGLVEPKHAHNHEPQSHETADEHHHDH